MPRPSRNAYAFIAVPLAVLFLFTLLPTVAGVVLSFFSWGGTGTPRFMGFENFANLSRDSKFLPALVNTVVFVLLSVPLSVVAGLALAVLVNAQWFRGRAIVRIALFLPTVVSIVAIGFAWRWVLDDRGGFLPNVLRAVHVNPPDFLQGGPIVSIGGLNILAWPMLSIIAVQVWRTAGFCMILYLAALQSVHHSLYEAAELDGASRWASLRHVTLPGIAPTTAFLVVTGVIGALQAFDVVWAMTGTAESRSTDLLNLRVFREFQQSRFGHAAAIGVVIFGLTALATIAHTMPIKRRAA